MRRRPPRSTRTDTLFPYTTLFRSEVLHHDAAVDGDIDVIAGVVIDPYAILANFRGLLEAAVVHGVPDHLPCVESRHLGAARALQRSEEHTSELQSLMRISYAVFCLKKKKNTTLKHLQYK